MQEKNERKKKKEILNQFGSLVWNSALPEDLVGELKKQGVKHWIIKVVDIV